MAKSTLEEEKQIKSNEKGKKNKGLSIEFVKKINPTERLHICSCCTNVHTHTLRNIPTKKHTQTE